MPDRSIIESGPPEQIAKAFAELFTDKIAATKIACASLRNRETEADRVVLLSLSAWCFSACTRKLILGSFSDCAAAVLLSLRLSAMLLCLQVFDPVRFARCRVSWRLEEAR